MLGVGVVEDFVVFSSGETCLVGMELGVVSAVGASSTVPLGTATDEVASLAVSVGVGVPVSVCANAFQNRLKATVIIMITQQWRRVVLEIMLIRISAAKTVAE